MCLHGFIYRYYYCSMPWTLYLDVVWVSQEHGETIDTHAPASSRWQSVLQRCAECLIDEHGFIVALSFGLRKTHAHIIDMHENTSSHTNLKSSGLYADLGLLLKELPLFDGIVQLGVSIADFLLHHKELEALRQTFHRSVPVRLNNAAVLILSIRFSYDVWVRTRRFSPFCQWTHDLRVITDKGRIDASDLKEISHQLLNETKLRSVKTKSKQKNGGWQYDCCYLSTLSSRRAVVLGGGHSTPRCAQRSSKNLRVSADKRVRKRMWKIKKYTNTMTWLLVKTLQHAHTQIPTITVVAVSRREFDSHNLLQVVSHAHSLEWWSEVNLIGLSFRTIGVISDLIPSSYVFHHS